MEENNKKGKLIIVRHTESEWNKLGLFTGKEDVHLSADGFKMSNNMGSLIRDIHISRVFTSMQARSIETQVCMMNGSGQYCPEVVHSSALNERDYGIYTGLSKEDQKEKLGEEGYKELRRSWDFPVPEGETLKMVYEREIPFFKQEILPILNKGKNVLIVSHGNTIRALLKYIENLTDEDIENTEMLFNEVIVYELDAEGHKVNKEIRHLDKNIQNEKGSFIKSSVNILATIGPSSERPEVLEQMLKMGMDMTRLNLHWGKLEEQAQRINAIRKVSEENNLKCPIIADLPGPRIQDTDGHTYDIAKENSLTENDKNLIKFGIENKVDYFALSFVGSRKDIKDAKDEIQKQNGQQKIMAKIEREEAVKNVDEIIDEADAIMIARGDLGNEIPLEQIPFVQKEIIKKCKDKNKPVVVATQMLYSMKDNPEPTRAEVTDVVNAVLEGADALMLSEETANGKYPINAVHIMEHIIREATNHLDNPSFNKF